MAEATDNTIHPVRPSISVALGDYGYFQNGLWYRLGNITNIRGYCCTPRIIHDDNIHDEYVFKYGVALNVEANANANVKGNKLGGLWHLTKSNNFFLRAMVEQTREYDSVDVEILDQIKRLDKVGLWKPRYCVVVKVLYASRYVGLFSSGKDNAVQLSASIDENVPFDDLDASVGLPVGQNRNNVEFVNHLKSDTLRPVGFMTVTWARSLKSWRKKAIVYVGDDEMEFFDEDGDDDIDSAPIVYNDKA